MTASPRTDPIGGWIIRVSDVATVAFTVVALAAIVALDDLKLVLVVVSLVLFAAGCLAFLWAFAIAVNRSRTDAIGIGGLYFLQGSAPRAVQVRLLGALAVQVVVAVVCASVHPFTSAAFAVLAPMLGLGLAGLWGARCGEFGPRGADPAPVRPSED